MPYILDKHIDEAADYILNLNEEDLEQLSEKHTQDQINFFGYLLSSAFEFENEQLLEFIVLYFNVFFEAAERQGLKLKPITDEDIEGLQDELEQTLEEYHETEDEDLIKTMCNQPMLLDFLLTEIHGEDEDGESFDEETKSQLFVVGIIMITLFSRAIIS